jgi:hypothetical protein
LGVELRRFVYPHLIAALDHGISWIGGIGSGEADAMIAAERIHADDTTVPVLDKNKPISVRRFRIRSIETCHRSASRQEARFVDRQQAAVAHHAPACKPRITSACA